MSTMQSPERYGNAHTRSTVPTTVLHFVVGVACLRATGSRLTLRPGIGQPRPSAAEMGETS